MAVNRRRPAPEGIRVVSRPKSHRRIARRRHVFVGRLIFRTPVEHRRAGVASGFFGPLCSKLVGGSFSFVDGF